MARTIPGAVIAAARASQAKWRIPASVILAQWALESGWGEKDLGCFNYFGMTAPLDKAGKPTVPFVMKRTREVIGGKTVYMNRAFRRFTSPAEAFDAHGQLLGTRLVYARARAKLPDVDAFVDQLEPIYDAKGRVLKAGYATDPNYAETLKKIMAGSTRLYAYNDPAIATRAA